MNDFLFLCVVKIKYGICLYEWESKEDSLHFFLIGKEHYYLCNSYLLIPILMFS